MPSLIARQAAEDAEEGIHTTERWIKVEPEESTPLGWARRTSERRVDAAASSGEDGSSGVGSRSSVGGDGHIQKRARRTPPVEWEHPLSRDDAVVDPDTMTSDGEEEDMKMELAVFAPPSPLV